VLGLGLDRVDSTRGSSTFLAMSECGEISGLLREVHLCADWSSSAPYQALSQFLPT